MDKITKDVFLADENDLRPFDYIRAKKIQELHKKFNKAELDILEKMRMYQLANEKMHYKIKIYERGVNHIFKIALAIIFIGVVGHFFPFVKNLPPSILTALAASSLVNLYIIGSTCALLHIYHDTDDLDEIKHDIWLKLQSIYALPKPENQGKWVTLKKIYSTLNEPQISKNFLSKIMQEFGYKRKRTEHGISYFTAKDAEKKMNQNEETPNNP